MRRRREKGNRNLFFWIAVFGLFIFLGFYTPTPSFVQVQRSISFDSN